MVFTPAVLVLLPKTIEWNNSNKTDDIAMTSQTHSSSEDLITLYVNHQYLITTFSTHLSTPFPPQRITNAPTSQTPSAPTYRKKKIRNHPPLPHSYNQEHETPAKPPNLTTPTTPTSPPNKTPLSPPPLPLLLPPPPTRPPPLPRHHPHHKPHPTHINHTSRNENLRTRGIRKA